MKAAERFDRAIRGGWLCTVNGKGVASFAEFQTAVIPPEGKSQHTAVVRWFPPVRHKSPND